MQHVPLINYEFGLFDAAAKGGWQGANNYSMWVELQAADDEPYRLLVRPDGKIRVAPTKPRMMHLIPAGCPFRITHLFAPWRMSDADTIYLRAVEPEGVFNALLAAQSQPVRQDHLVWVCPFCGHEIEREPFDTRTNGLVAFWPFHLERVRAAAAHPKTCTGCGKVHPQGYGFDRAGDTPQEAAARREW